jgi:hypothetical protein
MDTMRASVLGANDRRQETHASPVAERFDAVE